MRMRQRTKQLYRKRSAGVPRGYTHHWMYGKGPWKETKVGKGTWKVHHWRSTKRRKGSARGGPPVGTRIYWYFPKAVQRAVKVGPRTYKTEFRGTKKLGWIVMPRNRRRRRRRY